MKLIYKAKAVCSCGDSVLKDEIPLGTEYKVKLRYTTFTNIMCMDYTCGACNNRYKVLGIELLNRSGNGSGMVPLSLFEVVNELIP